MYFTYIIKSVKTGKLYIGQTNNIENRIWKHNSNKVFSTKNRGPWKLIYVKEFTSRSKAMKYERKLKSLKNKDYLLKIIEPRNSNCPE